MFNFSVGVVVVLPLPGWNQLVEFISTSAVLSFAFGPVALVVMRAERPGDPRPFRLPMPTVFSAGAFVLVGFIVYWTGWETNWKIFLVALMGLLLMLLFRRARDRTGEALELKASAWLWPYYLGLAALSYLGNYGNGLGIVPDGLDLAILAMFSLAIFRLALRLRLSRDAIAR